MTTTKDASISFTKKDSEELEQIYSRVIGLGDLITALDLAEAEPVRIFNEDTRLALINLSCRLDREFESAGKDGQHDPAASLPDVVEDTGRLTREHAATLHEIQARCEALFHMIGTKEDGEACYFAVYDLKGKLDALCGDLDVEALATGGGA